MTKKNIWVNLSILGLCMVALLGVVLRSKILFALPFINYNHLLESHSHFAFGGWVTLALATLLVYEILPETLNKKSAYQWLLGGIAIASWGMLVSFLLKGYSILPTVFVFLFIVDTYIFGWIFVSDLLTAKLKGPVLWFSVFSLACLVLSSAGTVTITTIFFTHSFNAFLYRDALFTYLHFQYNGFFTLAVLALLFHYAWPSMDDRARLNARRFTVTICFSIIPSLFLSYLWQDPEPIFRLIAIVGSISVWLSLFLFLTCARSLRGLYRKQRPVIRILVFLSLGSLVLKLLLQGFTIWPVIGNAIFGNRPVIMGFLHLVFLGFVTPFILAFLSKTGFLDCSRKLTKFALMVFAGAVLANEILLLSQGLTTMLMFWIGLFPWLLWATGIFLLAGAILLGVERIRSAQSG